MLVHLKNLNDLSKNKLENSFPESLPLKLVPNAEAQKLKKMNKLKEALTRYGSYLQREWEKAARTDAAIAEARAKAYENRLPRFPM